MTFPLAFALPNCHHLENLKSHKGKIISDFRVPYILAFDLCSIKESEVLVHAMKA
jgi:hypothetical protein